MGKPGGEPPKENRQAILSGCEILRAHPFFGYLAGSDWRPERPSRPFPKDGYLRIVVHPRTMYRAGIGSVPEAACRIEVNEWRRAEPVEWANVFGQAILHVQLDHCDPGRPDEAWRAACEALAADFLRQVGIGRRPPDLAEPTGPLPGRGPEDLARALAEMDPDARASFAGCGLAGRGEPTWSFEPGTPPLPPSQRQRHLDNLAGAFRHSISQAIEKAGDAARGPTTARRNPNSLAERARSWFIANYPLLASLAAAFDIIEDAETCERLDIAVAAVDSELRRVYVNPKFPWTYPGMQFVIAHELLHVGLRHEARRQGRDAYLWNVACDYVINGWLVEMGVGELPTDSLLLDPELGFEKESAEAIYDRIVGDLRLIRRLNKTRTLRGVGKVDVLGDRPPSWWNGPGTDLDSFYRRALADGLDIHVTGGRGTLPGDLMEEIRALQQPPIPWDVKLGQWLDAYFPPLERRRSFARASRRQASTPDIPRPVWIKPPELSEARTFGVVLDTSGSMSPRLLARGLGAIASYAMSRDVPYVRVIQCDAGIHDMDYVEPERLLQTVEVRGRGGTVLQPAIAHLESDRRFPKDAPILVITDGMCDALTLRRDHAFLMPEGARLPFRTAAPIFQFEKTA